MGPVDRPLRAHRVAILIFLAFAQTQMPRRISSTSIQQNRCTSAVVGIDHIGLYAA